MCLTSRRRSTDSVCCGDGGRPNLVDGGVLAEELTNKGKLAPVLEAVQCKTACKQYDRHTHSNAVIGMHSFSVQQPRGGRADIVYLLVQTAYRNQLSFCVICHIQADVQSQCT